MKAFAVAVLGWVLVPLLALAQERVELNTITGVTVNGSTVEITGSRKPNFTTFTMTDPPRLVIDISEAVLSGVPEALNTEGGLVTGLRTANYGSDASAIARVLIGYEREVETDIQVSGNVLVVKVLGGGGPAVAQAPEQPVLVAEAGTGAAEAAEAAQQEQQAAAEAAEAQRRQEEQAAAQAAEAAEAQRRQQEEAARAEAARRAEEERLAQQQAAAEAKKRQEDDARAAAEAKKQAEAEDRRRQQEEARAEAEAKKEAEATERKRKAEEAEARRVAAAEEKKRQQEEARAEAEAKKEAEAAERRRKAEEAEARRVAAAEEKKRQQEEARAAAEARRQAAAEQPPRVASAEPRGEEPEIDDEEAPPTGKRRTLELIGFQQKAGASRVYVRTNEPVRYKVSEAGEEIILELENTQIGKGNNTRALDTSFFDTAVARVDPAVGPDRSVRVSIKLKEQVPFETRQEGTTISLDFPRPSRR